MRKLTFMILLLAALQLRAQSTLLGFQEFYSPPVTLPLIGMEPLRTMYQQITEQVPDSTIPGYWRNETRLITRKAHGFYTELGVYGYDTLQQSWMPADVVDVYTSNYSATNGVLTNSEWLRQYHDTTLNSRYRTRLFYMGSRVDSLVQEKATSAGSSVFIPGIARRLVYSSGRIIAIKSYYPSNDVFTDTFYYDAGNHVIRSLALRLKSASSTRDSSTQNFYEYDSAGNVTRFSSQLYMTGGYWQNLRQTDYTYNLLGKMSSAITSYYSSSTEQLERASVYEYGYDLANMLNWYRQVTYSMGDSTDYYLQLNYDISHNPLNSYAYQRANGVYDTIPVFRLLLDDPAPLGMRSVVKRPRQVLRPWPNPVSGWLNLGTSVNGRILVFDLTGRVLKEVRTSGAVTGFNVEDLPRGMYILQVEDAGTARFFKQ